MEILVPIKKADWQESLKNVTAQKPLMPFNETVLNFIQEISRRILKDKQFRAYPELMAMAYWMRGAHLLEIKQLYENKRQDRLWLPRGAVLHFAPSNVDSIFMYSWFLSLLVGNANIVRLSQKRGDQITLLLSLINDILNQAEFEAIRDRTLVISYEHEEKITKILSEYCNVRVIWGGDETIRKIRAIPLSPNATELVFADKFSMSAINAHEILKSSEDEINKLAQNFYNDAFWFGQMACSSPRLIIWIGDKEKIELAKNRFWLKIEELINKKPLDWEPAIGVNRMVTAYLYAAQGMADSLLTVGTKRIFRVHASEISGQLREMHCGSGLFIETEIAALNDIVALVQRKDQTLSVFGFKKEELEELAWQLGGTGIDRIVSVGEALNFQPVWDGYDLLVYFTKEISIL